MKSINFLFPIVILALVLAIVSCKPSVTQNNFPDLDLLQYGVPIKIKAPEGSVVQLDDMGIVQDITVRNGEEFYLQIIAGENYESDISKVVEKQKSDAVSTRTFSKIIEEDDRGFIFEKKYSEERISYDFRYVRVQGDKEYIFQTGLLGQFTLEQVKKMYEAIK